MANTLKFMGTSSSGIIIPYTPILHPTDALTIEAMVYIDNNTLTKSYATIISTTQSGGFSIVINHNAYGGIGKSAFLIAASGVYKSVIFDNAVYNINYYNHIAATFNGRYMNVIINGILVDTLDLGNSYKIGYAYNNAFIIGNDPSTGNNFDSGVNYGFNNIITEVRFWNIARTVEEVKNNMNKPLNGNENGLIGYWRLNEGSGNTVYDLSINANNGTIYNADWVESDVPIYNNKYLIKQNNLYYTINNPYYTIDKFIPLPIENFPSSLDIETYGFYNINGINNNNNEILNKLGNKFDIKRYEYK